MNTAGRLSNDGFTEAMMQYGDIPQKATGVSMAKYLFEGQI